MKIEVEINSLREFITLKIQLMGLTQAEFGEKVGIDGSNINIIGTKGNNYPSVTTLKKIKEGLGVSYEDLFQFIN